MYSILFLLICGSVALSRPTRPTETKRLRSMCAYERYTYADPNTHHSKATKRATNIRSEQKKRTHTHFIYSIKFCVLCVFFPLLLSLACLCIAALGEMIEIAWLNRKTDGRYNKNSFFSFQKWKKRHCTNTGPFIRQRFQPRSPVHLFDRHQFVCVWTFLYRFNTLSLFCRFSNCCVFHFVHWCMVAFIQSLILICRLLYCCLHLKCITADVSAHRTQFSPSRSHRSQSTAHSAHSIDDCVHLTVQNSWFVDSNPVHLISIHATPDRCVCISTIKFIISLTLSLCHCKNFS